MQSHNQTPDPVPPGYLRSLIKRAGISQAQAAKIAHVLPQTLRRWLLDPSRSTYRAPPWAAVEMIRMRTECDTQKAPVIESHSPANPPAKTTKTPRK